MLYKKVGSNLMICFHPANYSHTVGESLLLCQAKSQLGRRILSCLLMWRLKALLCIIGKKFMKKAGACPALTIIY